LLQAAFFAQVNHQLFLKITELIPVQALIAAAETAFAIAAVVQLADTLAGAGNVKKLTLINHNRPLKHKRHSAYQQLCRRQKQNSPQACACGLSGETLTSWITAG